MLSIFQRKGRKGGKMIKKGKKGQAIWKFGQKGTKFENILKKGRWLGAIIARIKLGPVVLQVVPWVGWTIQKLLCTKVGHKLQLLLKTFRILAAMGCMIFLLPFTDVIELLMPTLYFRVHIDCGILCLYNVFLWLMNWIAPS